MSLNGPLTRYVKLRVEHAPGKLPGTFSWPPQVNDPDMHHGMCATHVLWCMPGSLTSSFLWSRWRGKRSQHSRCMCNPQFYVSGKRPTASNCPGSVYILFRYSNSSLGWVPVDKVYGNSFLLDLRNLINWEKHSPPPSGREPFDGGVGDISKQHKYLYIHWFITLYVHKCVYLGLNSIRKTIIVKCYNWLWRFVVRWFLHKQTIKNVTQDIQKHAANWRCKTQC